MNSQSIRVRVLPAVLPIDGREVELQTTATYIQWRYVPAMGVVPDWVNLIALSELQGPPGDAGIEMQSDGTFIQYRPTADDAWINIIALSDLQGPPGPATGVQSVVAGTNVSVDSTDPANPVVSFTGSSSGAASPQTRLSLTSATPAPESDVAGATSIYCVPCTGQYVPVYDGSAFVARSVGAQLTLALDATAGHTGYQQSGKNFDLFAIYSGSVMRLVTGPAWSSDVLRGSGAGTTELEMFNGALVNKNSITARFGSNSGDTVSVAARLATYLGSFRATANGQASDTKAKRLLYNAYNQVMRPMRAFDANDTWAYTLTAWRQANASAANQLEFLLGLAGVSVSAQVSSLFKNASVTFAAASIGLDGTTAPATDAFVGNGNTNVANGLINLYAFYDGYPGLGRHILTNLESGSGVGTTTWFGGTFLTGMSGRLLG